MDTEDAGPPRGRGGGLDDAAEERTSNALWRTAGDARRWSDDDDSVNGNDDDQTARARFDEKKTLAPSAK